MTDKPSPDIPSEIAAGDTRISLEELCSCCSVEAEWIVELVEHGAIEPVGQGRSDWQFTHLALVRVAKAKRLERDLALNAPGVALALDLLDEIDDLRARLGRLEGRG